LSRKVVQTFCIDVEELEKLEAICQKRHISKSELVREGLKLVLAERGHNQPNPMRADNFNGSKPEKPR